MLSIISGVVVVGAAAGGLWYAKPRDGQVRWFAEAPVLEWLIPIAILGTLAIGVGLMVSGVASS